MPYLGTQGDQLLLSLTREITRCLTTKVKFKATQSTQKVCFYTNIKNKINKLLKSYVVYQFCCPGCNSKYIRKTERNLCLRLEEHATDNSSSVFNHMPDCANYQYIKILYCIGNKSFDAYTYDIDSIQENTNIIDSAKNLNTLLTKEALHIKLKKPVVNSGLKTLKELQLFD